MAMMMMPLLKQINPRAVKFTFITFFHLFYGHFLNTHTYFLCVPCTSHYNCHLRNNFLWTWCIFKSFKSKYLTHIFFGKREMLVVQNGILAGREVWRRNDFKGIKIGKMDNKSGKNMIRKNVMRHMSSVRIFFCLVCFTIGRQ